MNTRTWPLLAGTLGLAVLLAVKVAAQSDEPPPDPTPKEGVEVLARGPVHEAYAEPTEAQPQPGPLVAKEPPAPVEEAPPDEKPEGENVVWVPGYWAWEDERNDF